MASLLRRLSESNTIRRHSAPNNTVNNLRYSAPPEPPSPNLQHLNADELRVLGDVFHRLERFEEVEAARISQLRNELGQLEEHMRHETVTRGSIRHIDLRLCRLCFRNKFADGVGRACAECQRRVCNQCGSFTKSSGIVRKKKHVKGRWLCLLCQKRRELACVSGVWFNGGRAQVSLNAAIFKRKVSDVGITSDWGCSADVELSDSSHQYRSLGHKTDSELGLPPGATKEDLQKFGKKPLLRRRLTSNTSTDDTAELADDEDLDVDDEQFLLERQRCRLERLQMQHRKSRKRQSRRSSVGTCTREDGVLPEPPPLCPKHGTKMFAQQSPRNSCQNSPIIVRTNSTSRTSPAKEQENVNELMSSEESLKDRDKAVQHPRVRELTIPTVPRKLSAPARIHDDHMYVVFSCESDSKANGPRSPRSPESRNRSSSVPGRDIRRSSSDGDTFEYRTKTRITERPYMRLDGHRSSDGMVHRPSKAWLDGNKQRMRTHNPGRPDRVSPPNSVYSQDTAMRKRHLPNRAEHYPMFTSTSGSTILSRSRHSGHNLATLNSPTIEYFRPSVDNPSTSKTLYSSLENVHRADTQLLKVPSLRPAGDVDIAAQLPSPAGRRGKRGSDDSQEDLIGRRISDTPSADTDAASSTSRRTQLRRSSSCYRFRVVLQRDPREISRRTMGLGMRVVGGKQGPDNKLGAFVTWLVKGGRADMAGIAEGDQVLEWNGRSLVDATFEETQQILACSGDNVQLIIMHARMDLEKRPSDCYKPPPHWRSRLGSDRCKDGANGGKENKDRDAKSHITAIVRTPTMTDHMTTSLMEVDANEHSHYDGRPIGGRIQLKLLHDTRCNTLIVTLMQAQDLSPRLGAEKEMPSAYAKLQILCDQEAKFIKTEPAKNSKNPEWMKTIEIANCDPTKILMTILLVTVWDSFPVKADIFLGEVLLDLKSADLQNDALWYRLSDHDENTGQLPPPTPKTQRKSLDNSVDELDLVTDQIDSSRVVLANSDDNLSLRLKPGRKIGILKKRVSEVAMKMGAILADKRTNLGERPTGDVPGSASVSRGNSITVVTTNSLRKERRLSGQLISNLLLGKNVSRTNSQSSNTVNTTDNDDDSIDTSFRPAPEGDDITSMLGPGQVPPKPSLEKLIQGDIKLGFMITKGQLEVDVICGKGLSLTDSRQAPDTYVKTYLVGGGKRLQKRKTKTIKSCTDPLFRQKLKYSACNVHGRYMQVLIKEKSVGFDRNPCLGEVVVKLDQLDLSSHTMGWYKLFKESAVELGSCESLTW